MNNYFVLSVKRMIVA